MRKKSPEELAEFGRQVRTKNRNRSLTQTLLAAIICLGLFLGYMWYQGDFTFLFRSTNITTGVVTKTENRLWGPNKIGGNFYTQDVYYEFVVGTHRYNDVENVGRGEGIQAQGDSLIIKYAVSDPEVHRVLWNSTKKSESN